MNDDRHGATSGVIDSLVGIYNAKGTALGEITYWIGARLGRTHCALCSITHGSVREKPDWRACRESLPVPFTTVHLDERDADLIELSDHQAPCVVARTSDGPRILVPNHHLEECLGSPERLVEAVYAAATAATLTFAR